MLHSSRCWTVVALASVIAAAQFDAAAQAPPEQPPLAGGSPFGPAQPENKGVATLRAQFTVPAAGQPGRLFLTLTIAPGWHIYSITQPPGGPLATEIEVSPPPGVRVAGPFQAAPPADKKQEPLFDNLTVESHHGTVTWFAPVELAPGVDLATVQIRGKVTVQACDAKSCLPAQELPFSAAVGPGIALPSEAASGPAAAAPAVQMQSVLVTLGFAFLGGLILNLMPCVLPVISLKILAFLEQGGQRRGRVFLLNVWYAVGLMSVFMLLAALAATAGFAWGEQFTLTWFKVAMTALVFVMALSFLGVWEIPIPGFLGAGRAGQLQTQEGPSGAFFKGVFATILATPCSGPFLGPVFGYLLQQPPYMAYWIFGAVGLGMASPYLVIGAFPELIRFLPKPGAWMETVQHLMGFLLLATMVYLFNTLSPRYFVPTLAMLIGLWFACQSIGRTPLTAPAWRKNLAWIGGPAVATLVGVFAFTVLVQESKIPWQPFSPEALQRARAEGRTVMVDFTANWCPNCKTNSKFAIETEAVAELVKANGVTPLLADWTDQSPTIKKALNDLGRNSIPLLAIWPAEPPDGKPIILSDLLIERQVLDALKAAGPSQRR